MVHGVIGGMRGCCRYAGVGSVSLDEVAEVKDLVDGRANLADILNSAKQVVLGMVLGCVYWVRLRWRRLPLVVRGVQVVMMM